MGKLYQSKYFLALYDEDDQPVGVFDNCHELSEFLGTTLESTMCSVGRCLKGVIQSLHHAYNELEQTNKELNEEYERVDRDAHDLYMAYEELLDHVKANSVCQFFYDKYAASESLNINLLNQLSTLESNISNFLKWLDSEPGRVWYKAGDILTALMNAGLLEE